MTPILEVRKVRSSKGHNLPQGHKASGERILDPRS